jgi:hypothetical protein
MDGGLLLVLVGVLLLLSRGMRGLGKSLGRVFKYLVA